MIKVSGQKFTFRQSSPKRANNRRAADEGGWALLSLILTLTILSIVLTSSIQPNYQLSSQREKEAEMMYRGQQMAEGIARWYNNGNLNPASTINLSFPPAYGYLKELKKLKEGVMINLREIKFVRPSALNDPFDGEEWEPVYARDQRIMPFLQAWAAETGGIIPPQMMLIAGPPVRTQLVKPKGETTTPGTTSPTGTSSTSGISGTSGAGGAIAPSPPPGATAGQQRGNPQNKALDDDDDDDEDINDPLQHLFSSGNNQKGLPIVGVAPRRKGPTIRAFYGLKNYEEWVFIYMPTVAAVNLPTQNQGRPQTKLPVNQ